MYELKGTGSISPLIYIIGQYSFQFSYLPPYLGVRFYEWRINMNNAISYSLIMLLAGLGIPIMAALNGGLATKLNSPALAATILFSVGLVVAVIYLIFTEGVPSMLYMENTPWYFYSGGFL